MELRPGIVGLLTERQRIRRYGFQTTLAAVGRIPPSRIGALGKSCIAPKLASGVLYENPMCFLTAWGR